MNKNIVSVEKLSVVSNVSDHYPLKLVLKHRHRDIKQENRKKEHVHTVAKIKWDKIDKMQYETRISKEVLASKIKIRLKKTLAKHLSTLIKYWLIQRKL